MGKYNEGDTVLLNGTLRVTLLSWPDTDTGPFNYEYTTAEPATARGMDYAEIVTVEPLPAEDAPAAPATGWVGVVDD